MTKWAAKNKIWLYFICALLLIGLVFPVTMLLANGFSNSNGAFQNFIDVFSSNQAQKATFNSIISSAIASIIAVVLAYVCSYYIELKCSSRFKKALRFIMVLPMLVPSMTHGMALIYLFGQQGIMTKVFGLSFELYGANGIVLGSVLYAFPAAFLIIDSALASLDYRLFELDEVMGANHRQRLFDFILPVTKYAVFSAFIVAFTMVFTDYGVALSVGGNFIVLPVLLYQNVIGLQNFNYGAVIALVLLAPSIISFFMDIFYFGRKQIASKHNKLAIKKERSSLLTTISFWIVSILIMLPMLVVIVTPFIKLWPYDFSLTLDHFYKVIVNNDLLALINNTVFIGLVTSLLGCVIAFFVAYLVVRANAGKVASFTHFLILLSMAVPGLALGVAYVLFFRGTYLYNTFSILIVVNIMHFIASPYLMAVNHFKQLNPNLESTAITLGASFKETMLDIIAPQSRKLLTDMFVYFFTNAMITISAISFLYNSITKTLSIQITNFNDIAYTEGAIVVSLVILVINVIVKVYQARLDV